MASHLEAVGFQVDGADEVQQLLDQALTRARASGSEVEHSEGRTLQYVDPSGAAITIHIDYQDDIVCMKPGFVGESRFWWRPLNVYPDGDCRFCDLVFADFLGEDAGEEYYTLALEVETIGADRALIPYGDAGEVTFAALCIGGEVSESEAEFRRAQEAEWASAKVPEALADTIPALRGFASKSLVPSGLFTEHGEAPSSDVLAFGIVASVEQRQNELGGGRFMLVRLETLGGTFETCIAPRTLEGEELLAPGSVVGGTFWLVGHPLTLRDDPGPVPTAEAQKKRRGIRGLFGRRGS